MTIVPAKLHHVSRMTQKLEETRQFYIDVLGFRDIPRPPFSFGGAWLYGAGIQIHLIEEPFSPQPMELNNRDNHVAFAVADMEEAEAALKARGITYQHRVVPERGTNQLFFKDPDGWMIELAVFPNPVDQ